MDDEEVKLSPHRRRDQGSPPAHSVRRRLRSPRHRRLIIHHQREFPKHLKQTGVRGERGRSSRPADQGVAEAVAVGPRRCRGEVETV
jgi:hypothetical protein